MAALQRDPQGSPISVHLRCEAHRLLLDGARGAGKQPSRGAREVTKDSQLARCIWLTGLPGSGKSTLASLVEHDLMASGHHTFVLSRDNVRYGLNRELGFNERDRVVNMPRAAEVAWRG